MLHVLLDTNIVIFVVKQRPPQAAATFNLHAGRMAISAVSLAELLHGAEKSSRPAENLAVVEDFCSRLEVLPYGPKAAMQDGQTRLALDRLGTPIGVNDLHMAAHACSEGRSPLSPTSAGRVFAAVVERNLQTLSTGQAAQALVEGDQRQMARLAGDFERQAI